MSDFLATPPGLGPVKAGLDMNQPGPASTLPVVETYWGDNLVECVKNGTLSESDLDGMVCRILTPYFYLGQNKDNPSVDPSSQPLFYNGFGYTYPGPCPVGRDVRGNHSGLIRDIAAAGTVLLENQGSIIPLNKSLTNIGLFGNDAADPSIGTLFSNHDGIDSGTLISGGGSGSGRPSYVISPLDAFKSYVKDNGKRLQYVTNNTAILSIMPGLYPWPDVCIVFLKSFATEGFDRKTLVVDDNSIQVVNSISSRCPRGTVVVTHCGGPEVMPWTMNPNVSAIVAAHYPGQELGNSILDVLTGNVNPSGKLPLTIAKKEEDYTERSPTSLAPQLKTLRIGEALYEFGYGLSYTTFGLSSNLVVSSANKISARASLSKATLELGSPHLWETVAKCHAEVSNTCRVAGATVIQLYASLPKNNIPANSPVRILLGFKKVSFAQGVGI
ncbi:hypothetical protein FVER14953_01568 [Fusarium verticillioides]|nr:hypothetical protein FVER14953_01568 [Fusarium verticillioides]